MSFHLGAEKGDIAEKVLLPGDPLRAKNIAEKFLSGVKQYNSIRNMFGFTGTYKGEKISVQGTGMGMPSMAIYANELIKSYGAKKLIRVGTCGALHEKIHVRDVVMAQASTTDSSMCHNTFGYQINFAPTADFDLLEKAATVAKKINVPYFVGNVLSQDRLYDEEIDLKKLARYGILAAEMESAALYLTAARRHVQALSIFTVSNHLITGEETTAQEREESFDDMIKIALEAIIAE